MKNAFEHCLNLGDGRANRYLSAQFAAKVVRGRQVIGMGVGFQDPLDRQVLALNEIDEPLGRQRAGTARSGVVVQHRIDQCAVAARLVEDDITYGARSVVKEGFYLRRHPLLLVFLVPRSYYIEIYIVFQ